MGIAEKRAIPLREILTFVDRTWHKRTTVKVARTVKRERSRRRAAIIRARVSASELLLFRRLAKLEGLSESAFLRSLVDTHARQRIEANRIAAERAAAEQRELIAAAARDVDAERERAERDMLAQPSERRVA